MVLGIYLVVLGLIGFWPSPVDKPVQGLLFQVLTYLQRQGFPTWFNYSFVEASANILLFVPVGVTAALALPASSWWQKAGLGLFLSVGMELGQLMFLDNRFASIIDVVTNTAGTVIGLLTFQAFAHWFRGEPRDKT